MRFAPDRPWLPFTAEQRFSGAGIDFRWEARIRMGPFITTRVVDAFETGRGSLAARIFGVIPIAGSRGPEMDRGEALRGLAELPWRPFAFREGGCVRWLPLSNEKLRGVFDDGGTQATLDFRVDPDGRVLGAVAEARPRVIRKQTVDTPWAGRFGDYQQFGPFRIPAMAEVSWILPEGPFCYWRGRITQFGVLA